MGSILDNKEKVHNKAHNIFAAQECQKHPYDAKHESHKVKYSYKTS